MMIANNPQADFRATGSFAGIPAKLCAAAENINWVLDVATEARALPLSDTLPIESQEASRNLKELKQVRSNLTRRLVVFQEALLPLSKDVVTGIREFVDYLVDESTFTELAKCGEVDNLCNHQTQLVEAVQQGYELLASDLLKLRADVEKRANKVRLDIKNMKQQSEERVNHANSTQDNVVGNTFAAAGVVGAGSVWAATELGALALIPASAVGGFTLGVLAACIAVVMSESGVARARTESTAIKEAAAVLEKGLQANERMAEVVNRFASAMTCLAGFFSSLQGDIEGIQNTASRITDGRDREEYLAGKYGALYRVLCGKAARVSESCTAYLSFCSEANIKVTHLQSEEGKDTRSYIEEWFAEQEDHHPALEKLAGFVFARIARRPREIAA